MVEVVPSVDVGKMRCPMYSVAPSSSVLVITVVNVPLVGALTIRVPAGVADPSVPVVEMTVVLAPAVDEVEIAEDEGMPELPGTVEV